MTNNGMITREEYEKQLSAILSLAGLMRDLQISEVLNAMTRAETVGPIIDPTLYIRAAGRLSQQRQIVEAALAFQARVGRVT